MENRMAHFGDPCIHCGSSHENLTVGGCQGDEAKARPIRLGVVRQAWENPVTQCVDIIVLMSSGWTHRESHHPSSHWRYSDRLKDVPSVSKDQILKTEAACQARSLMNAAAE